MIKAILFDFGGVITESPFEAFNKYESDHGLPKDYIRTINSKNHNTNAWARLERGEVTPEDFDALFETESREHGFTVRGLEILKLVFTPIRENMVSLVETYKHDYKTACLTNNFPRTKALQEAIGEGRLTRWQSILDQFPHIIESAEIGHRKPERKFFEKACDVIGVNPESAVFLDDIGSNLKPAREMGMTTIKVISGAQAERDLKSLLNRG